MQATQRREERGRGNFLVVLAVVLYSCRGRSEGQTAFRVSLDDRPCLFQSVMKKRAPQTGGRGLKIF